MDERPLEVGIVLAAADDWVSAIDFTRAAMAAGLTDVAQVRDLALGMITRLIASGVLFPIEDETDRSWDCTSGHAIEEIARRWSDLSGPHPLDQPIVWLEITAKGERLSDDYLHRWGDSFR